MICGIYKITSPSNSIYIGKSINIEKRFDYYRKINASIKGQKRLYNSLKKYTPEGHKFEVIHECKEGCLNTLEILYIAKFKTFNSTHGLNLRSGGGKSSLLSEETRQRLSVSGKKRRYPLEIRHRLGNGMRGKKHSQETKIKMRLSAIGKNMFNDNCVKVSQFSKEGIFIRNWDSMAQAKRVLGIQSTNIRRAIITGLKAGWFIWKRTE